MGKWIAEFELEDGDTMPEHMDLNYKGAKIDFYCRPLNQETCEDAVSRQAVLKEIPALWNSNGDKDYCMETLRDFVVEMPSVTPTRKEWIPVSERLPEENGGYLVTVMGAYVTTALWVGNAGYWSKITAWMPLPQPYKADMSGSKMSENPTGSD